MSTALGFSEKKHDRTQSLGPPLSPFISINDIDELTKSAVSTVVSSDIRPLRPAPNPPTSRLCRKATCSTGAASASTSPKSASTDYHVPLVHKKSTSTTYSTKSSFFNLSKDSVNFCETGSLRSSLERRLSHRKSLSHLSDIFKTLKQKLQVKGQELEKQPSKRISTPYNFKHVAHVGCDKQSHGFANMPAEWTQAAVRTQKGSAHLRNHSISHLAPHFRAPATLCDASRRTQLPVLHCNDRSPRKCISGNAEGCVSADVLDFMPSIRKVEGALSRCASTVSTLQSNGNGTNRSLSKEKIHTHTRHLSMMSDSTSSLRVQDIDLKLNSSSENNLSSVTPTRSPVKLSNHRPPKSFSSLRYTLSDTDQKHLIDQLCTQKDPLLQYTDFEKINQGATSAMYVAKSTTQHKPYAIRRVFYKRNHGTSLLNELHDLSTLSHKNLVKYVESFWYDNDIWVVLEHMNGGTLKSLLRKCALREQQIAAISYEVCLGLAYLHSRGIIHRDVKSENILLSSDGKVKLGNFGCTAHNGMMDVLHQTESDGSYWLAPEVIMGEKYNSKLDVWSLGILALEMAHGLPPELFNDTARTLNSSSQTGIQFFHTPDSLSQDFRDYVIATLTVDVAERPTVLQLLKDFSFLQQREPLSSLKPYIQINIQDSSPDSNKYPFDSDLR
ncbi:STE/STE20/PAKA protein kinase [Schizosaccharomyces japonicus yFS275]|uniref:STE/STE20/PAKA protein kinase n=1 Tax=Schizosaccharomyces japonicus (strain yFS275 / FY16936) TaxID=402676 RepID=B6JZ61_SCHJY|nr:STE/STE20/PAKA protein kinase [Schizosaccharomyces japonicus yFS275]EEB06829.1 STE/STE20/PAKA protein kinase [Schizosaccharomyces japonicus yFS275]